MFQLVNKLMFFCNTIVKVHDSKTHKVEQMGAGRKSGCKLAISPTTDRTADGVVPLNPPPSVRMCVCVCVCLCVCVTMMVRVCLVIMKLWNKKKDYAKRYFKANET